MFCLPNLKRHKIELKTAKAKENIQEKKKKKKREKERKKKRLENIRTFSLEKEPSGR